MHRKCFHSHLTPSSITQPTDTDCARMSGVRGNAHTAVDQTQPCPADRRPDGDARGCPSLCLRTCAECLLSPCPCHVLGLRCLQPRVFSGVAPGQGAGCGEEQQSHRSPGLEGCPNPCRVSRARSWKCAWRLSQGVTRDL